jgi:hypothetical protein
VSGNKARRYLWIGTRDGGDDGSQPLVLHISVRLLVGPLELDTDRVIVAAAASPETRIPGVPGTAVQWHELDQFAVAAQEQMRRYPELPYFVEIGMGVRVERVAEKRLDVGPAEFAWRETDTVHDQQLGGRIRGSLVLVRRGTLGSGGYGAVGDAHLILNAMEDHEKGCPIACLCFDMVNVNGA